MDIDVSTSEGLRRAIAKAREESFGLLTETKKAIAARITAAQRGGAKSCYITKLMPIEQSSRDKITKWLAGAGCNLNRVRGDRLDTDDWQVTWT